MSEQPIRLFLLGDFEVRRGKSVLRNTDWRRRKAASLLQRLALERRLLKEQVMEFLWPGRDPSASANNLYRTLYALRRTLDQALGDGASDEVFTFKAGVLNLAESTWVDVEHFERLCAQGEQAPQVKRRALLEEALELYGGDLLPAERYADWTLTWRTRLRRQRRQASLDLAALARETHEYNRAIELLAPLLDDEPTDEPVHRELMRAYALAGRRNAALRQYEACVEALEAELNVPPDDQTTTLCVQIRDGQLAPPDDPDAEENLAPALPLFGREAEVRLISAHLDNPLCRLLTLTGPGGVGKTRLAIHVAALKRGQFEHGVRVVSMASLSTPDLLVSAIADALDLSFPAGRSPQVHLLAHLRRKRLLLVLDNFEHLMEAAPLLLEILARAPGVKLLVTSSEQLNLRDEWVIEIRELSCPEDPAVPNAENYGAVQLFVDAAQRLQPNFALSDQNRQAVVRLCQLTGGLPLALELAASRIRTLPVATLADEIVRNPDVLATSLRDVPERHRSLRAVFEESWKQLTQTEQTAFRRLAVFEGSFTRDAAERVAGATLSVLSSLVAKSRLRRTDLRYELHPLLRQFGLKKLAAAGEADKVLDRHYQFYAGVLEAMAVPLRGGHDSEALASMEAEIHNIRAAWSRAVARRDVAALGRGVEGLALFYQIRGRYAEALDALRAAIRAVDPAAPGSPERAGEGGAKLVGAKLLAREGSIYFCLHRYDQAGKRLEESLAIFQAAGAHQDMAFAYRVLGDRATLQELPKQAKPLYLKCMAIYTEMGDRTGIAWAHNRLGWVSTKLGEYGEAERHLHQAITRFRELDHRRGLVGTLGDLGFLAHRRGAYKQAIRYYREAIDLSREIGYEDGLARSLYELADVCRDLGQLDRAREYLSESLALYRELGSLDQFLPLYRLGQLSILRADFATAEEQLHESLALSKEADAAEGVAHTILLLGELALARGDHRDAQRRFREGLTRFEEIGDAGEPWGILEAHYGLGKARARQTAPAQGTSRATSPARGHLHAALAVARELPSVPHLLALLVELAPVLASEGEGAQALELVAFALDHPAARSATQERARALFSEWTTSLTSDEISLLRDRVLSQELDEIVGGILRATS
jgi:predicted ATPase/DNA-binding SARP family transcriptional activator